jgi:hypothetical protein
MPKAFTDNISRKELADVLENAARAMSRYRTTLDKEDDFLRCQWYGSIVILHCVADDLLAGKEPLGAMVKSVGDDTPAEPLALLRRRMKRTHKSIESLGRQLRLVQENRELRTKLCRLFDAVTSEVNVLKMSERFQAAVSDAELPLQIESSKAPAEHV